jgi:hypothetical protein
MLIMEVPPTTLTFDPKDYREDTPEERYRANEILRYYTLRHPRPTVVDDRVLDGVLYVSAAILLEIPMIEVVQINASTTHKSTDNASRD